MQSCFWSLSTKAEHKYFHTFLKSVYSAKSMTYFYKIFQYRNMMSGCCSRVYASLFRCSSVSSSPASVILSGQRLLHSANSTSAPKSALAKLRKKTGYSLSLCKQALEANEQDVARAQNWLKEQALKQGWAKANKLEGRNTAQGLVGLLVRDNSISMVELNCETDFVSRNSQFHELLNEIAAANLKEGKDKGSPRVTLGQQELGQLKDAKGHSLADLVALNIGQIGENLVTRRGVCLNASSGNMVSGVTHPSASIHTKEVQYGRYGAAMVYTVEKGGVMPSGQDANSMARQICQHIIGMNPQRVGDLDSYKPELVKLELKDIPEKEDEGANKEQEMTLEEKEDAESVKALDSALDSHEELIRQDFVLNPEVKVGRVLLDTGIRVRDFVRYEVGEDLD